MAKGFKTRKRRLIKGDTQNLIRWPQNKVDLTSPYRARIRNIRRNARILAEEETAALAALTDDESEDLAGVVSDEVVARHRRTPKG